MARYSLFVPKVPLLNTEQTDISMFAPDTTRDKQAGEIDGELYYFTTQEQMLKDIANNQYVEYGQFDGNYYGTKYDTIRQCIRDGKMCILDISPQVISYTSNVILSFSIRSG